MPLTNEAYLEVDRENRTGIFQLTGVEPARELNREMLIGPRGQALQGAVDLAGRLPALGALADFGDEGEGFTIDGGQGQATFSLAFEITQEDMAKWGDGSGDAKFDQPTGTVFARDDVLHYFCRTAQTDSLNPGRLYWSEWTDGTYASGAGAHGGPVQVLVRSLETQLERDDTALTGTITLERTDTFPDYDPDDVADLLDDQQ